MTPSQITRTINWIAMPIALALLAMVAVSIYQRHFVQQQSGLDYQFDDLPSQEEARITVEINDIISRHIFGVVPKKTVTAPPKSVKKEAPPPAPKTRLNIKLTGVIDSDSPESGMAFIEVERGRTLVIAVGEQIGKTDAVLQQVLPGEILINRDGTLESVKMVRKTLSMKQPDKALYANLPQPYVDADAGQPEREAYGSSKPQQNLAKETTEGERRTSKRDRMPTMRNLPVPGKFSEAEE